MLPVDTTTQQQVVVQAAACGVDSRELAMEIDGGGGDLYVTIKANKLAEREISCLMGKERSAPYPIYMFADPAVSKRSFELEDMEDRKAAREWLHQRGLLARLPSFDPVVQKVAGYTAKLESLC